MDGGPPGHGPGRRDPLPQRKGSGGPAGEHLARGKSGGQAVASASTVKLVVKGKGKKKKTLNRTGKVKLNLAITYTPTGGDPSTQSMKVQLKKKL